MSKTPKNNQEQIHKLLFTYLDTNFKDSYPELEVRFGTRGVKPISRIDYENVIKKLLSLGFQINGGQKHKLNIISEYVDPTNGKTLLSNVRTEMEGLTNIQDYCRQNSIVNPDSPAIEFVRKSKYKDMRTGDILYPVNYDDWSFRVSLQQEYKLDSNTPVVHNILSNWKENKKIFRLINRIHLIHPDYPVQFDISITKSSNRSGRYLVSSYNIEESNVFNNPEVYEIEIEIDYNKIGKGTNYDDVVKLHNLIKKMTKFVLSGLQETNFPCSYVEQHNVIQSYLKMYQGQSYKEIRRVYPSHFIGPSSYTLQMNNIMPINENVLTPNIRKDYTVTEKADGMRKMLYIHTTGKIYLIDTNMHIQFTGAITHEKALYNSLLDGEHILHNKQKEFINLYAAFDIYFIKGVDVRAEGFMPVRNEDDSEKISEMKWRFPKLINVIKMLEPVSIVKGKESPIHINHKNFYDTNNKKSIFAGCNFILKK